MTQNYLARGQVEHEDFVGSDTSDILDVDELRTEPPARQLSLRSSPKPKEPDIEVLPDSWA